MFIFNRLWVYSPRPGRKKISNVNKLSLVQYVNRGETTSDLITSIKYGEAGCNSNNKQFATPL